MTKSELAVQNFHRGYNCCQAVVLAFADELGFDETILFRATEGFGLGCGNMKNTCGAVIGMVNCLGLMNSAGDMEAPNTTKRATMGLASQLTERFVAEHGSMTCEELKGRTGLPVVPCDKCVADAAAYVEEALRSLKV